ncbi:phage holin family protein [Motilimonas sp. 1_MG-2023]|uniref:phage holin family protein n=1 Tax=Motilimonas sp. 1_MG-2023 TaxID=3062672 RepID=UPI0026E3D4E3|nr:phage holin family protein [Motilimonas sp. 1_MG-2023]MDO6525444.1 phage holin family protein [Motilimonas sp. 1_MG-2023]
MIILTIHIVTLLMLAFRIMLFSTRSRRRPVIAWLAYVLMCAAFVEAVQALFGMKPPPSVFNLIIEVALTLAVFCHGGNIAHLFKPQGYQSKLSQLLCWSAKNKKVHQ